MSWVVRVFMHLIGLMAMPFVSLAGDVQTFDLGVESMRSHGYSVAIFAFMMLAIAIFVGIIVGYMKGTKGQEIKTGEKVMFGMILLGVVFASIFAAVQLLDGFLF